MTDGLGFYELLRLGEELGSEIAMAVQDGQHSGPGRHYTIDDEYPKLVTDAVDMIEFANGEANATDVNLTPWAKLRQEMGHPSPFAMKRVEIGNEEVDEPTGENSLLLVFLAFFCSQCNRALTPVMANARQGLTRYTI